MAKLDRMTKPNRPSFDRRTSAALLRASIETSERARRVLERSTECVERVARVLAAHASEGQRRPLSEERRPVRRPAVDCHCPPYLGPAFVRGKVWIRCEHDDGRASEVCFLADHSLGPTEVAVSAEIQRRMAQLDDIELPAIGRAAPLPFKSATIKRVAVW